MVTLKWPPQKITQVVWEGWLKNLQPCLKAFRAKILIFFNKFLNHCCLPLHYHFNGILVEFVHSTNTWVVCCIWKPPKVKLGGFVWWSVHMFYNNVSYNGISIMPYRHFGYSFNAIDFHWVIRVKFRMDNDIQ